MLHFQTVRRSTCCTFVDFKFNGLLAWMVQGRGTHSLEM